VQKYFVILMNYNSGLLDFLPCSIDPSGITTLPAPTQTAVPGIQIWSASPSPHYQEELTTTFTPTIQFLSTPTPSATPLSTKTLSPTPPPPLTSTPTATPTPAGKMNCTRQAAYWQDNPQAWPVREIPAGDRVYRTRPALEILKQVDRTDLVAALAGQLIAAMLNIAQDADPGVIQDILAEADEWLVVNPPGSRPTGEAQTDHERIAARLAEYNHGQIGPGACVPETPRFTPTPPVTPTPPPSQPPSPTSSSTPTATGPVAEPSLTATTGSASTPSQAVTPSLPATTSAPSQTVPPSVQVVTSISTATSTSTPAPPEPASPTPSPSSTELPPTEAPSITPVPSATPTEVEPTAEPSWTPTPSSTPLPTEEPSPTPTATEIDPSLTSTVEGAARIASLAF